MAQVRVFVDDAVLGQLPSVCAKEGTATGSRLRVVHDIGRPDGLGLLWLLLLVGPVGWVVLALLVGRGTGERLVVEVPWSDEAYERFTRARRRRNVTAACGLAAVLLAFLLVSSAGSSPGGILLVLCVLVGALACHWGAEQRYRRASVGVDLDGSRRWVTLRRVHPDFAAACTEQVASHHLV